MDGIHTSTFRVWQTYQLGQTVHRILNDPIIEVDGDLTETRDYSSYDKWTRLRLSISKRQLPTFGRVPLVTLVAQLVVGSNREGLYIPKVIFTALNWRATCLIYACSADPHWVDHA